MRVLGRPLPIMIWMELEMEDIDGGWLGWRVWAGSGGYELGWGVRCELGWGIWHIF